jgi:hypothetical protein
MTDRINSVGKRIIYLDDNSSGIIIEANVEKDEYLILFDDGIESAQRWKKFKISEPMAPEKTNNNNIYTKSNVLKTPKPIKIDPGFHLRHFYHITHISNLDSILKHGILSHEEAYKNNRNKVDISSRSVQKRRERIELIYKRSVHAYVPLYLNPRNPMLYTLKEFQNEIIILEINASILLKHQHLFSDGNSASSDTSFSVTPNILENCFEVLNSGNWTEYSDGKRIMCAEVLVFPNIPPNYINRVICNSLKKANTLNDQCPLPVSFEKSFYF